MYSTSYYTYHYNVKAAEIDPGGTLKQINSRAKKNRTYEDTATMVLYSAPLLMK